MVEDDESILDNALENGVFHWLLQTFLNSKTLKTEEFYQRRFHQLLTDLIVLMPLKVSQRNFSGVFWRQLNCSNLFPESNLLRKNQWLLVLGYKKCRNFSKSKEKIFP